MKWFAWRSFLLAALSFCGLVALPVRSACPTCSTFGSGIAWGIPAISSLTEASGIASSRKNSGILWVHNDGTINTIYAIATNGTRLANFRLNRSVDDVEDIAVGPGPTNGWSYLYVGDIGGNVGTNSVRSTVRILRIPEPLVSLAWASDPHSADFAGVESFTLTYPDGQFDAECLMVDPITGDVIIATKQAGYARFYRANLNGLLDKSTVALQFLCTLHVEKISAGDISPDGTQILLRREDIAGLWTRCEQESISNALSRAGTVVPIIGPPREPNGEAIGFLPDGTGYVTISEGTNAPIYFFEAQCPAPPHFTLTLFDTNCFLGGQVQFSAYGVGYPAPSYSWRFNGQPLSPTNATLVLSNVALALAGTYQVILSNASGMATSSATLTVRPKPDVRITEVFADAAVSPGVATADWWELTSFEAQPVSLTGWRFNDSSGGLADPFVISGQLIIAPGESIVFVDSLTAAQFQSWWGAGNLPVALKVVTYAGSGLGLGASGDGLRLWNETATDTNDTIARVDFGTATAGISFNYDPLMGLFGALSQLGVNGVVKAAAAPDIGSPGRIVAPIVSVPLIVQRTNELVRIEFPAVLGHRYSLESRDGLETAPWESTGDTLLATNNARQFFEKTVNGASCYYRIRGD